MTTSDACSPGSSRSALELVATIGPRSQDLIREILDAGATALRLNSSHLGASELRWALERIRQIDSSVPVVVDLQGAKMRLGRFAELSLKRGTRLHLALGPAPGVIPVPHPELFTSVKAGDTLSCDDGRIQLRIEAASADSIDAVSLSEGVLSSRKGVNRLEHPLDPSDLSTADLGAIEATRELGAVSYALSFLREPEQLDWVRRRAAGALVIAKIERREALGSLSAIAENADALWICRGDLGVQLGFSDLARAVASINPRELACPALMAGQVFEHLTHHSSPTRSEICHLGDLLSRGYRGLVMSDETAIGVDPPHAVRVVADLLRQLSHNQR